MLESSPAPGVDPSPMPLVPVLSYHHVHDEDDSLFRTRPALFRQQLELLLTWGYQPVSARQLLRRDLPSRPVLVTFDDAYENFALHAWPILASLGIPCTLFVIADVMGEYNDWDEMRWSRHRHATREQLSRLCESGLEIGSHANQHEILTRLSDDVLRDVLHGSRRKLESAFGGPVCTLAYPGGAVDSRVRQAAADVYEAAFATSTLMASPSVDRHLIPRFDPCFCGDPDVFKRELERHSAATYAK